MNNLEIKDPTLKKYIETVKKEVDEQYNLILDNYLSGKSFEIFSLDIVHNIFLKNLPLFFSDVNYLSMLNNINSMKVSDLMKLYSFDSLFLMPRIIPLKNIEKYFVFYNTWIFQGFWETEFLCKHKDCDKIRAKNNQVIFDKMIEVIIESLEKDGFFKCVLEGFFNEEKFFAHIFDFFSTNYKDKYKVCISKNYFMSNHFLKIKKQNKFFQKLKLTYQYFKTI